VGVLNTTRRGFDSCQMFQKKSMISARSAGKRGTRGCHRLVAYETEKAASNRAAFLLGVAFRCAAQVAVLTQARLCR
jgi:hypothetical protein